MKLYSIEGNIGSGKSKLIQELKKEYKDNKKILFLEEPVKIWETIKDEEGINIIDKFYNNIGKYSFKFQMMAYISRLKILKESLNKGYEIIIMERSLYTDKNIFCQMLYDDKMIDEIGYQIYNKWFDYFLDEYKDTNYIYLKTSVEKSYERIKKRARPGEENLQKDYLENCNNYHNNWLNKEKNKLILDGNIDIKGDYKSHIENIKKYIQN